MHSTHLPAKLSAANLMAHPTKLLFESIITSYDTLSSIYRTEYSGFYSRVLIDFERGRFWTREYVLGLSENIRAGGSIEDQSDVDLESSQKLMLSIQNALHTVSLMGECDRISMILIKIHDQRLSRPVKGGVIVI